MWRLRKKRLIAFAELDNRQLLENIRALQPRFKYGRITEVLQAHPSAVKEGEIYEETRK